MSTTTPPPRPAVTPRVVWDHLKTPLTLAVLLLAVWAGARWGWKAFTAPIPEDPPVPCQVVTASSLKTDMVSVTVENGSTERGRASGVAANLRTAGFNVTRTGNSDERITQTIIRGTAADSPEVVLVAGFFKNAKIEADARVDHTVDVLVGARNPGEETDEWAGMNKAAATELALPTGKVCLPASSASPTATATPR